MLCTYVVGGGGSAVGARLCGAVVGVRGRRGGVLAAGGCCSGGFARCWRTCRAVGSCARGLGFGCCAGVCVSEVGCGLAALRRLLCAPCERQPIFSHVEWSSGVLWVVWWRARAFGGLLVARARPPWGSCRGVREVLALLCPSRSRSASCLQSVRCARTWAEGSYLVDPASGICLFQRLSHACLSMRRSKVKPRIAHYNSRCFLDLSSTWITVVILELIHAIGPRSRVTGAFIRTRPSGFGRALVTLNN